MKSAFLIFLAVLICAYRSSYAQVTIESDSIILSALWDEGTDRSKVMEILLMLTDLNGPRLTNSPGFHRAANTSKSMLQSWGLDPVLLDEWDEDFGTGWGLKKFSLSATGPIYTPLIAYPKAWSPGVKGTVKAEAVYLDVREESDLEKYRGRLKGKIVLFSLPEPVRPSFSPDAWRYADSTLEELAGAKATTAYRGRRFTPPSAPERLAFLKWKLCEEEGVIAVLEASSRLESDGTLVAGAATVPHPPEVPYGRRVQAWSAKAPKIIPQVVLAAEHYNMLVRQCQKNEEVTLELALQVEFYPSAPGINVIGEIQGSDLRDEVVMIGAHLDSWHSATGTTDNAVGSAVMMEAMRLIKSLGERPRRTIRVALWGGEEQGLLGSRSYVRRKLGGRLDQTYPYDSIRLTPEGDRFSVYFNMDYGAGKYRGIYLQGNENALPVFEQWMKPFEKKGAATISLRNATGTDHLSFDAIGLPAFQFIQDPLEYATRTHHANMDVFERVVQQDLIHNAIMTAWLAWMAANHDQLVPRDRDR